jgi:hypothetical protein
MATIHSSLRTDLMRSRRIAWALVAYGVSGLALLIIVASAALDAVGRVERIASSANSTLDSAAVTAEAAADAVIGANDSLERGAASASDAASLSRDASVSLRSLGRAMELSIFGAQPLLPLADDFDATADQAESLADELDGVGDALTGTQSDISVLGGRLQDLADDLAALSDAGATPGDPMPPLQLIVGLLMIWLVLPAVAALIGGALLLRALS